MSQWVIQQSNKHGSNVALRLLLFSLQNHYTFIDNIHNIILTSCPTRGLLQAAVVGVQTTAQTVFHGFRKIHTVKKVPFPQIP